MNKMQLTQQIWSSKLGSQLSHYLNRLKEEKTNTLFQNLKKKVINKIQH